MKTMKVKEGCSIMNISRLTQQDMKEIMWNAYQKGQASDTIGAKELIEEIKRQILSALGGNDGE